MVILTKGENYENKFYSVQKGTLCSHHELQPSDIIWSVHRWPWPGLTGLNISPH